MNARKRQRQDGATSAAFSAVYDLMVPIPKESTSVQIQDFLQRLGSTGFTHVALTHTVFGMPRPDVDDASTAIPESLWQQPPLKETKKSKGKQKAKQQPKSKPSSSPPPVKVLRRLNAVLENLSDVAHYVRRNNQQTSENSNSLSTNEAATKTSSLLQEYDLVSVCPRTDGTFVSACKSATASDIIVLDYSLGRGGQLPYRIRPTDVRAAVARNAVFEIPYGPAILNQKKRKGLIHTCRLLQMASANCKPKIILSSGSRLLLDIGGEEMDGGVMAFRTPADLINMMEVVMKFDRHLSFQALHTAGTYALQQAQIRRFGKQSIRVTAMAVKKESELLEEVEDAEKPANNNDNSKNAGTSSKKKAKVKSPVAAKKDEANDDADSVDSSNAEENVEDGFISF